MGVNNIFKLKKKVTTTALEEGSDSEEAAHGDAGTQRCDRGSGSKSSQALEDLRMGRKAEGVVRDCGAGTTTPTGHHCAGSDGFGLYLDYDIIT